MCCLTQGLLDEMLCKWVLQKSLDGKMALSANRCKCTDGHENMNLHIWTSPLDPLSLYKMAKLPVEEFPPPSALCSLLVVMQYWRTALGQLLSQSLCTDMTPHARNSESSQKYNGSKKSNRKTLKTFQKYESLPMQRYLNADFLVGLE